jgi:hypothetical protein
MKNCSGGGVRVSVRNTGRNFSLPVAKGMRCRARIVNVSGRDRGMAALMAI